MTTDDFPFGYKLDTALSEKYPDAGLSRKDTDVSTMLIHGTAGALNWTHLKRWMLGGERDANYRKSIGLFPYLIDDDGMIIEIFNPHKWFFTSHSEFYDVRTIAVEHTNADRNNAMPYTDAQYKADAILFKYLTERFENLKYLQGHNSYCFDMTGVYQYPQTAQCPGAGYDWNILRSYIIDLGFHVVHQTGSEKIEVL